MLFGLTFWIFCFVTAVYVLGGYIKGAIGFALPVVAVAGAATVVDGRTAVATAIVPVLVANSMQVLRAGLLPMIASLERFWITALVLMIAIGLSAPLLAWMPDRVFLLILGVGVGLFGGAQLAGWRPVIAPSGEKPWGVVTGAVSGFFGGVTGSWGAPVVIYLSALSVPKIEQVRATGVIFLLGGFVVTPVHIATGVLNETTGALSFAMVPATVLGVYLGQKLQDRLDQDRFRRITLIVLVVSSANLLRRAAFG